MSKEKEKPLYNIYDRVYVPGVINFYGTIIERYFQEGEWWYKIKRDDCESYYHKTANHIKPISHD